MLLQLLINLSRMSALPKKTNPLSIPTGYFLCEVEIKNVAGEEKLKTKSVFPNQRLYIYLEKRTFKCSKMQVINSKIL